MNKKVVLLGCVLLFLCFVVLLGGGFLLAWNSNNNIPVFSDLVEKVERIAANDQQSAKIFTDALISKIDNNGLANLISAQTFGVDYKVNGSTVATGRSTTFDLSGQGSVDTQNKGLKLGLTGNLTADTNGQKLNPSVDLRVLLQDTSKVLYLNLSNIPQNDSTYSTLNGKWIKLDIQKLGSDFNFNVVQSGPDQTQINKFKDTLKSDTFINNFKRLPDEVIGAVRTNCFEEDLTKSDLEKLAIQEGASSTSVDNLGLLTISGCVGRKDQLPYKFNVSATSDSTASDSFDFKFSSNFKDFNKAVTVDEPKADLDLNELIQQIISSQVPQGFSP